MPLRLEASKVSELKQAYLSVRNIMAVPVSKRSAMQDAEYQRGVKQLQTYLEDFFLDLNEEEFSQLRVADFKNIDDLGVTLESIAVSEFHKAPKLKVNIDVESIQRLIADLYTHHSTAQGVLEESEPMLDKWDAVIARARSIAKGLSFATNEWEAESVYNLLMPRDILSRHRLLKQHVEQAKLRCINYKDAYDKISRYITTMQTEPQSMNRQTGDDPHQPIAPKSVRPSWRDRA